MWSPEFFRLVWTEDYECEDVWRHWLGHLHHGRQRWGAGTEGPPGRRQRQAKSQPRSNWLPALELTGTSPSRYRGDLHNSGWWMGGRSLRLVLTLGVGSQLAWNGSWCCQWVGHSPGPPTGSFIKHRHPLRRRPRWSQGVAMPLDINVGEGFPPPTVYPSI